MFNSFATLWTIGYRVPLSMRFPRHEYESMLPFPSPGDLSNSEIESKSLVLAGGFFTTDHLRSPQKIWKSIKYILPSDRKLCKKVIQYNSNYVTLRKRHNHEDRKKKNNGCQRSRGVRDKQAYRGGFLGQFILDDAIMVETCHRFAQKHSMCNTKV